ncbi:MAG: dTDP-glucose 4,6-dehydratase [Hydrotalea sp.]|nr:dTDP-glucose 4,6-dehydratase [Hydrotalea sp.]
MRILVTGGAGFIGSCFVRDVLAAQNILPVERLVNLDKLTYAGNLDNLLPIANDPRYVFQRGDIGDEQLVTKILQTEHIDAVVHFAAESHVDRSILSPDDFITTNIVGTAQLLKSCHGYWQNLPAQEKSQFRFLHISTDEVFGSLEKNDAPFDEASPYRPNSPYAASKAGADHLVRAYHHTYGLPTIIGNCTNNYGHYQFPEKFIPLMITRGLSGEAMPIYGKGENIRDWLFVGDHARALMMILAAGKVGEVYGIGGNGECDNLSLAKLIADLLDKLQPKKNSYHAQLTYVKDRPGHDFRYGMNIAKIGKTLGFKPMLDIEKGLALTVAWYLQNQDWVKRVVSGDYQDWLKKNYGARQP